MSSKGKIDIVRKGPARLKSKSKLPLGPLGIFQTVNQVSQFVKVSRVIELISIFGFLLKS